MELGLRTPPVGARIGLKKIPSLVHALKTYRSFYTFCTKGYQSFNFFELTLRFNNILQLIHPLTNIPAGLEESGWLAVPTGVLQTLDHQTALEHIEQIARHEQKIDSEIIKAGLYTAGFAKKYTRNTIIFRTKNVPKNTSSYSLTP